MRAQQENVDIQKVKQENIEAQESNNVKALINAFEGTDLYEILQAKARELKLLSNPDIKISQDIAVVKVNNEWEDRLKLEEERLAQLKEAHERQKIKQIQKE